MSVIIWLDFSIRHLCNYPGGRQGGLSTFFCGSYKASEELAKSQRPKSQSHCRRNCDGHRETEEAPCFVGILAAVTVIHVCG